jgi:hypothetical protein
VFRAGSDSIEDLNHKVREGISRLKGLEVGNELGVEILAQLIEGKKTVSEIVERIYGVTSSDEGFASSYGRVWREIRRLESRGLVSRKFFGNEKPYRLTDLAVTNLARIGGEEKQIRVIPRVDMVSYLVTITISVVVALHSKDLLVLPEIGTLGLFVLFGFSAGISFTRGIQSIRRVF